MPYFLLVGWAGAFWPAADLAGAGLAGAATFFSSSGAGVAAAVDELLPLVWDAKKAAAPAPSYVPFQSQMNSLRSRMNAMKADIQAK